MCLCVCNHSKEGGGACVSEWVSEGPLLVFIMAAAAAGGRSYARPPPFGCGLFHPSYYTPLHTRPILLRTVYREKIENLSFLLSLPVCVLFHNLLSLPPPVERTKYTNTWKWWEKARHGTGPPISLSIFYTREEKKKKKNTHCNYPTQRIL